MTLLKPKFYKDNRKVERNQNGHKIERGDVIIADVRVNKNIPPIRVESNYHDPRFNYGDGYFDYSHYSYVADASYAHNYDGGKYTNPKSARIQGAKIDHIEDKICKGID